MKHTFQVTINVASEEANRDAIRYAVVSSLCGSEYRNAGEWPEDLQLDDDHEIDFTITKAEIEDECSSIENNFNEEAGSNMKQATSSLQKDTNQSIGTNIAEMIEQENAKIQDLIAKMVKSARMESIWLGIAGLHIGIAIGWILNLIAK